MANTKISYKSTRSRSRSTNQQNKKSVKSTNQQKKNRKSIKKTFKTVTRKNKRKIKSRNKSRIKKGGMEDGQDDTGDNMESVQDVISDKMDINIEWIDNTRNNFSIEVKSDDTIHDSILNNLGEDIRGRINVFFGDDMIERGENFEDRGIEEGARLQVAFLSHPGELLIGKEFMTPEMPDEDPGEEDNRRLIKTWTSLVGKVWTFGYAHDENNEKYWHPLSDDIGGKKHRVIFGTDNLNLPKGERAEQRERVQQANNNVHEALLENGWIPRAMPRRPWVYPTTHYIHNSFVGHDGKEKPDAYWECREGENSY